MRILNDAGYPIHPDVGSRKVLLRKMGDLIPKLQIRQRRVAIETARGPASDLRSMWYLHEEGIVA